MFGKPIVPYETLNAEQGGWVLTYSPDASDAFKAATGRPLAHLKLIVAAPDDTGNLITGGFDHYYDPPPFTGIVEAANTVNRWTEQWGTPDNPTTFPAMREQIIGGQ